MANRPLLSQRDVMRILVVAHKGDESRIIKEYIEAERLGKVERQSNSHGLSAEEYALRLYRDGLQKGWLFKA
jgi:hypothetical protein